MLDPALLLWLREKLPGLLRPLLDKLIEERLKKLPAPSVGGGVGPVGPPGPPGPAGDPAPSDHGLLGGLADDDHPQYHTDARGDARYLSLEGGTLVGQVVSTGSFTGDQRYQFKLINSDASNASLSAISLQAGANTTIGILSKAANEYTIVPTFTSRLIMDCDTGLLLGSISSTINIGTGAARVTRLSVLNNGNVQVGLPGSDTGEKFQVNGGGYFQGHLNVKTGFVYQVNATAVVGARKTGWTAATGTATRTSFATSSVTTAQLAERVKALIDDLINHGLIGA